MVELGMDTNGITEESIRNLEKLKDKTLVSVDIKGGLPTLAVFYFEDDSYYLASGFGVGYGGEGPQGLFQALKMWYHDELPEDFWKTNIPKLNGNSHYIWKPEKGFIEAGEVGTDDG